MNIYKMNYEETIKKSEEFKKTNFGKRAFLLSLIPFVTLLLLIFIMIVDGLVNNDSNIFVLLGLISLNFAVFGVSLMMYFSMLKDYVNSKNDK